MAKLSLEDLEFKGKRVLVRVDFNVPLDKKTGEISDDLRIRASLPTIKYIIEHGGKAILASHLGRPDGQVVEKLRMNKVAQRLEAIIGKKVKKLNDCIGPEVEKEVKVMKEGEIVLLENVRFHPEEEENNPDFARALASLADLYVSDAFGTVHRSHASTAGVAKFIPAASGFLLKKEIDAFDKILHSPDRPFVVILGGAKVSDKIGVIENLMEKCDTILIGGAMAFTFEKSRGLEIGSSLVEEDKLELARTILEKAEKKKVKIITPLDHVVATEVSPTAERKVVSRDGIPPGWKGLDIGPKTVAEFKKIMSKARTILWNGPLGVFEVEPFSQGTMAIAKAMAECKAMTVVGGGDSVAAVTKAGVFNKISHVSTGGGASLELLEGKDLPGISVLMQHQQLGVASPKGREKK